MFQADTPICGPNYTPDSTRRYPSIMIATMHHEDRIAGADWPLMLKVVSQCLPGFHRQRQNVLPQ